MKKETLNAVADILGNGYKCYVNMATEEVFSAENIDVETRKSTKHQEFVPLEGTITFGIMQDFVATIDDFEHQSELMEALSYDQPFLTFKRKVYALHLADSWIAYRTERIVALLEMNTPTIA